MSGRPQAVVGAAVLVIGVGAAEAIYGLAAILSNGVYPAAIIGVVIGSGVMAVGVGILARRRWARLAGLVVTALIGVLTAAGIPGSDAVASTIGGAVVAAACAAAFVLLTVAGDKFSTLHT